jgi:putative tryptophan/tyrosine transport system substrate-binding protein
MRRREFIAGLGSAAAWPPTARAQQRAVPVIGFLHSGIADAYTRLVGNFRQGLKEVGYIENENVIVAYRWANAKVDQLPMLAADLVHRQVAVILAAGPQAAFAAKAATSTIPIVVAFGSDPVKYGLATSLSRPGGNVTGATFITTELTSKRLELLGSVVPQARTVGFLFPGPQQSLPADEQLTNDFLAAARLLGRQALVLYVDSELRDRLCYASRPRSQRASLDLHVAELA